jgi:hypothetical protein
MRHSLPVLSCAVLFTATLASGQTTKSTGETKVKSDNGQVVTVTGCVMIGGATNFLLSVASERDGRDKAASAAPGSYALIERDNLDLGRYINQRVELTGVVVPAATKGDADDKIKITDTRADVEHSPDKKPSATKTVKVARGAAAQFIVASVKTLAPVCSQ